MTRMAVTTTHLCFDRALDQVCLFHYICICKTHNVSSTQKANKWPYVNSRMQGFLRTSWTPAKAVNETSCYTECVCAGHVSCILQHLKPMVQLAARLGSNKASRNVSVPELLTFVFVEYSGICR